MNILLFSTVVNVIALSFFIIIVLRYLKIDVKLAGGLANIFVATLGGYVCFKGLEASNQTQEAYAAWEEKLPQSKLKQS